MFGELIEARPRDVNLNVGVSDHEGRLAFFEATTSLGMSTFCPEFAAGLRRDGFPVVEASVPVLPLATLCERYVPGEIDFLKIDVESHEDAVIRGGDFARWRPRVLVIESTGGTGWEPTLLAADYLFATFDGLNRYYVRREDEALRPRLATPANCLDDYIYYEHARDIADLRWDRDRLRDALREAENRLAWTEFALEEERRRLDEATDSLRRFEGLGPSSIAVARRFHHASLKFPAVASAMKTILRGLIRDTSRPDRSRTYSFPHCRWGLQLGR